ncbi:MAG TPA: hypothetical protein VKA46_29660 [Gemmataceae bacterium]|nr:hypothetical protein [Gemmataceae bacterium]
MIYHYTVAGLGVRRLGLLQALPLLVYRDLLCRESVPLGPVVWFTTSPVLDRAVACKAMLDGITPDQPGAFWRFAVAESAAPLSLPEWAQRRGHPPELFRWMLLTAQLAGSDYRDWRLAEGDVPARLWQAVEVWDGRDWRAAP